MVDGQFKGDKKVGQSLLSNIEKRFVNKYVSKVPKSIETYHLTLMTIIWCTGIVVFSYFTQFNIHWLWLVSLMIVLQYITDLFDGAVGRYRNTGLIKWGYYMDHYLDFVFLSCILIGYSFIVEDPFKILFYILVTFGAFMVNAFLSFATTDEFKISYMKIGPTEIRIIFILINTLIIFFGKTYLSWSLPYLLIFSIIALNMVVYRTQKYIWQIDMKNKKI